jgi:hypothetical protein
MYSAVNVVHKRLGHPTPLENFKINYLHQNALNFLLLAILTLINLMADLPTPTTPRRGLSTFSKSSSSFPKHPLNHSPVLQNQATVVREPFRYDLVKEKSGLVLFPSELNVRGQVITGTYSSIRPR